METTKVTYNGPMEEAHVQGPEGQIVVLPCGVEVEVPTGYMPWLSHHLQPQLERTEEDNGHQVITRYPAIEAEEREKEAAEKAAKEKEAAPAETPAVLETAPAAPAAPEITEGAPAETLGDSFKPHTNRKARRGSD